MIPSSLRTVHHRTPFWDPPGREMRLVVSARARQVRLGRLGEVERSTDGPVVLHELVVDGVPGPVVYAGHSPSTQHPTQRFVRSETRDQTSQLGTVARLVEEP